MELLEGWRELAGTLRRSDRGALSDALGERLLERWSEAHRHYHDQSHLAACLGHWQRFHSAWQDAELVALAIWYHDAIYDPCRLDNEAASAVLAREDLCAAGVAEAAWVRVAELIHATSHRDAEAPVTDPDRDLLLAIDLAVLGADPARYAAYARDIRREYAHLAEPEWRRGRSAVLQSFLERRPLFPSVRLAHLEGQARDNLRWELAGLVGTLDG